MPTERCHIPSSQDGGTRVSWPAACFEAGAADLDTLVLPSGPGALLWPEPILPPIVSGVNSLGSKRCLSLPPDRETSTLAVVRPEDDPSVSAHGPSSHPRAGRWARRWRASTVTAGRRSRRHLGHGRRRPGRCESRSAHGCWRCCTRSGSSTCPRRRRTRRCSTRAPICARPGRCTGCWRAKRGGVRERRDQLAHPAYAEPELLAERPNELWSWDISKLKGPVKLTWFSPDRDPRRVHSRYAIGWTVQYRETDQLATALIEQATEQQHIGRDVLTVHADRGGPMRSKPVAFLLRDLGAPRRTAGRTPRPTALQRSRLRDAQVPARVPRAVRRHRPRPLTAGRSSTGTTTSTATPGSG